MKSMFWELYHGNICGKDIRLPEKTRKEEFALYDKLKATLSEESDPRRGDAYDLQTRHSVWAVACL